MKMVKNFYKKFKIDNDSGYSYWRQSEKIQRTEKKYTPTTSLIGDNSPVQHFRELKAKKFTGSIVGNNSPL